MSKYKEMILAILLKKEIKSTNEILEELLKKADKIINWHLLYSLTSPLTL
jgi:hypothetical protein